MYFENLKHLEKGLLKLQSEEAIKGIMLFGCDKNSTNENELKKILKLNKKPLLGSVFPELFADGERKEIGFLIQPLFKDLKVLLIDSDIETSIANQLSNQLNNFSTDYKSVFCFLNFLWKEKNIFVKELYNELGPFVKYLGGCTGSLKRKSFPCVFANQGIYENAAVLGLFKNDISFASHHGLEQISDPIKITECKDNTILTLNWEPAFKYYENFIESHSKKVINKDSFFELSKSYALGLVNLDSELIIRDLFTNDITKLNTFDKLIEGEYISIMYGNASSLLKS
ncbi:MAG: hypothetical protein HWD82_08555 [Flavobacteriaceae bacterium]|nr:hypothetical protein [Flavobacteriaceae bacterium]